MFKSSYLTCTFLMFILLGNLSISKSQENSEQKKLEVIVKLSRFIDYSQNKSFNSEKKLLYIITDNKSCAGYKGSLANSTMIKGWEIICTDKILDFKEGSVLFITKNKEKFTTEIIKISEKKDILTISENSVNFCTKGGMINIIEGRDQIKFEINYRIIQNKSIDISSKLLALSKIYN
jgi:hypothetical protein